MSAALGLEEFLLSGDDPTPLTGRNLTPIASIVGEKRANPRAWTCVRITIGRIVMGRRRTANRAAHFILIEWFERSQDNSLFAFAPRDAVTVEVLE